MHSFKNVQLKILDGRGMNNIEYICINLYIYYEVNITLQCFIIAILIQGCTAELQVKSGKKFEGILSTVSPTVRL